MQYGKRGTVPNQTAFRNTPIREFAWMCRGRRPRRPAGCLPRDAEGGVPYKVGLHCAQNVNNKTTLLPREIGFQRDESLWRGFRGRCPYFIIVDTLKLPAITKDCYPTMEWGQGVKPLARFGYFAVLQSNCPRGTSGKLTLSRAPPLRRQGAIVCVPQAHSPPLQNAIVLAFHFN